MNILVLNGGSSSIKACLYALDPPAPQAAQRPLWRARVEFPHLPGEARLRVETAAGPPFQQSLTVQSADEVLAPLLETLWSGAAPVLRGRAEIHAVGHRIVHGGKAFRESTRITAEVKAAIAALASFAPEHNHLEVEGIEAVEAALAPATQQVAVFDTAFHASLAPEAYTYPGPYDWLGQGVRRYGFHGISHQYVSRRAAGILGAPVGPGAPAGSGAPTWPGTPTAPGAPAWPGATAGPPPLRMITCHLGNGCSLAAIRDGRSIDTTMGFTPLDGLMMGTRSGAVDPGILIHLVRHCGSTAPDLDRILNKQSGLLGISGLSGDMREIQQAIAQGNDRARLAYAIYLHRLCAGMG